MASPLHLLFVTSDHCWPWHEIFVLKTASRVSCEGRSESVWRSGLPNTHGRDKTPERVLAVKEPWLATYVSNVSHVSPSSQSKWYMVHSTVPTIWTQLVIMPLVVCDGVDYCHAVWQHNLKLDNTPRYSCVVHELPCGAAVRLCKFLYFKSAFNVRLPSLQHKV